MPALLPVGSGHFWSSGLLEGFAPEKYAGSLGDAAAGGAAGLVSSAIEAIDSDKTATRMGNINRDFRVCNRIAFPCWPARAATRSRIE